MATLCVYCGSSDGALPAYRQAAQVLGQLLAQRGHTLVYGGGRLGLMGAVADAALAAGGRVLGVIPRALQEREVAHTQLSELHLVDNMHQRKAMMADLADAFITLPGGLGTLEELFEMLTWLQLGLHGKRIGLLNVAGFYDGLLAFIARQQEQGFVRAQHASLLLCEQQPEVLLQKLLA
ncbi:TIGR00730 family Rossman fold protein [Massilia sp. W12]|uniref:LOG family protein n=1 Tax=Massilia sp. W12 TaxID=3126507 RepID=UPI0030D096A4